jgi:hypothetical protein
VIGPARALSRIFPNNDECPIALIMDETLILCLMLVANERVDDASNQATVKSGISATGSEKAHCHQLHQVEEKAAVLVVTKDHNLGEALQHGVKGGLRTALGHHDASSTSDQNVPQLHPSLTTSGGRECDLIPPPPRNPATLHHPLLLRLQQSDRS